uniref:LAGLIDADG endonuclease n=1 Tax=Dioszegia changbaiensis TaxID=234950 RepID=A0A7G7XQD3_9TREE|nr:LAGLIDADG endonuclease [Dioszegia changbaiensis]
MNAMSYLPIVLRLLNKPAPEPLTREQFSKWLTGFIDGEGNFQVFLDGMRLRVAFRIRLHIDDIGVLHTIKAFIGGGSVTQSGSSCLYTLSDLRLLSTVLLPLLNEYKLFTTKWFDYLDFKSAVVFLLDNNSRVSGEGYKWALALIQGMNSTRSNFDYSLMPTIVINAYWLLGFIEGEGTFGFKNLSPYFQLGQHTRSLAVLTAISAYLSALPNGFNFTVNSPSIVVANTLNKRTSVSVLSIVNVDALFDTLLFFLISMPFQTRKGVDFYLWALGLYLHKFGYFYLSSGRSLLVAIASYINTGRYSTNLDKAPAPTGIEEVLATNLPVTLTPEMSHLALAQAFSRLVTSRLIYVYDMGILVEGSPFSTHGDALVAIGKPRTGAAVKRYIDTGKLYMGRYTFHSSPNTTDDQKL